MNDIGKVYINNSSWQKERWNEIVSLLHKLKINKNSFKNGYDLGCGTGQQTLSFLNNFPSIENIIAIDSNRSMIRTAKKINNHCKIHYKVKRIEELLCIKSKKVDFILANYSMHWVKNKRKVLKDLNNKLEDGTLLIVGTVEKLPNMLQTIDNYLNKNWKKRDTPYYFLTKREWLNLLNDFNWEIIAERKQQDTHIVKAGVDFFREWYAASAGAAFYNKGAKIFRTKTIKNMMSVLSKYYGINNNKEWSYKEDTYLFIAQKKQIGN